MINHRNKAFGDRVEAAKKSLGPHYAILVNKKYPQFSTERIRNVANRGSQTMEILLAMEECAEMFSPEPEKNFLNK